MALKVTPFKFETFSQKQLQVLTWWLPNSPVKDKDMIIADGSVRSGKTVSMSLSYVQWSMDTFDGENLGMAGKTIGSFRRNVLTPLKRMLKALKYRVKDHRADNMVEIRKGGKTNFYYIFGGKDERSQDLIQGITLAGMLFDEVALMPQSFVNQATARCSVNGAKLWFNCNPEGPYHWFNTEYILKAEEKNAVYLHFTMDDNLSLSKAVKDRYKRMYSGVFFKRYILGLWVMAAGVIYDMFSDDIHKVDQLPESFEKYYVGIDYATGNPTVFLIIGLHEGKYYVVKEYYYDSRAIGIQKTDAQYAADLKEFIGDIAVSGIFIDPSAASFITELNQSQYGLSNILDADNTVIDGIRTVCTALSNQLLFIYTECINLLKEFFSYIWDEKAQQRGEDKPLKQFDHCLDALRYVIYTLMTRVNPIADVQQTTYDDILETDYGDMFG